jgi:imidazolonepropionase-like amidohydrolase
LEVLESIVETAHSNELEVAALISERQGIVLSIKAGVDELAHTPCFKVEPSLLRRAISQDITMVSTLHIHSVIGCPRAISNARTWLSLGGSYVYGSDMGNRGIPDALDIRELELMKKAGLSPTEVLRAATSDAGANLGLAPLGKLTPGAVADLIVVDGNPLDDLHVLKSPTLVMSKGRIVRRP